jgi:hypothetical protein
MCTLGEHVWLATRDMTPGIRAQSFEPATANGNTFPFDTDPPPDRTLNIDIQFTNAVAAYWHAAKDLTRLIDRHRPDRWTPLPEPASDDRWCRNHLQTIGACVDRYRGDLCRLCYDLHLHHPHHQTPDPELMRTRDRRGYLTTRDINAWLDRTPTKAKKRRKKAS